MVSYIVFMSNMMTLVAKDAASTGAPHLQPFPTTPGNNIIQVFWDKHNANTSLNAETSSTSTVSPLQISVANPMVIDGDHHDSHCLVDFAAIWLETLHTSALISNLITTLTTPPMLAVTLQASQCQWSQ